MSGPYETEKQARELAAVRAVYEAFDRDPGAGKMAPHNYLMLIKACEAAGVELGAYDQRIVAWLAGWEPETAAVICGLISRAGSQRPRPRIDGSVPAASWVAPDGTATLLLPDLVLVLDAIQAACDFCTPELAVRLRSLAIRLGDDRG